MSGGQSGRFCVFAGQAGTPGLVAQPTCNSKNIRMVASGKYLLIICLITIETRRLMLQILNQPDTGEYRLVVGQNNLRNFIADELKVFGY